MKSISKKAPEGSLPKTAKNQTAIRIIRELIADGIPAVITIQKASQISGASNRLIRDAISDQKIVGFKRNKRGPWLVERSSLVNWMVGVTG